MEVQNFKALVKQICDAHYETGQCTLKLQLLDHDIEDLDRFRTLQLLKSSVFERFNFHIRRA